MWQFCEVLSKKASYTQSSLMLIFELARQLGTDCGNAAHGTIGYKNSPLDSAVQEDELNLQMQMQNYTCNLFK